MATITVETELDVTSKYRALIKESLGSESLYIRTKETLDELFKEHSLSSTDKTKIISGVLTAANQSVVTASMSTALQWAAKEKDVALAKLELARKLDILDHEVLLKEAQVNKMLEEVIAMQAQVVRTYGTPTILNGKLASLTDTGKMYEETRLLGVGITNAGKEGILLDSKKTESQAAIHKVVADTYRNYGSYTFTLADGGLSGVSKTHGSTPTLSDVQEIIAKEQANGYSYNAWASALSGAASMLGTALAGEYDPFGGGGTGDQLLGTINSAANKLNLASKPY
jgi:hypothetical protein